MLFSTSFRILTIKWSKRCFPNFKTLFEHLHEKQYRVRRVQAESNLNKCALNVYLLLTALMIIAN